MERTLRVGDRVIQYGWKWKQEDDKLGVVVETYNGTPATATPGIPMMAVKWDVGGETIRGYINGGGTVQLEPYRLPPMLLVPRGNQTL